MTGLMKSTALLRRLPLGSVAGLIIGVLSLSLSVHVVFEKKLVGTITPHEWGRYLFGLGAAITKSKYGIGGFVAEDYVELALMQGGLSDRPLELDSLGVSFPNNLRDPCLLQSALESAHDLVMEPPANAPDRDGRYSRLHGSHGSEVGLATYTRLSFLLFGFNLSSLSLMYFAICTLSLVLFTVGHWRNEPAMLVLAAFMVAYYTLISSPLIDFNQLDVKDPRFLSTLAAIPALHILVYWLGWNRVLNRMDHATLVAQCLLVALVLHVRGSALWVVAALSLSWLLLAAFAWLRGRLHFRDALAMKSPLSLFALGALLISVVAVFLITKAVAPPLYSAHGEILRHTFWHGMFYGLQAHPEWEKKYGESVEGASDDAMPLVATKIAIRKLPAQDQRQYLDRDGWPTREAVERFSRILFFEKVRDDPEFIAYTFFVIRPLRMAETSHDFYESLFQRISRANIVILVGALILIGAVAAARSQSDELFIMTTLFAVGFALVAWLPNWLVAFNKLVMADHFLWGLFGSCAGLVACGIIIVRGMGRLLRGSQGRQGRRV